MKTPDILNSKIKKIRIELPHYSFSHSSSGDSPHVFIGRERTREKLKKIIEDSPDEPGVYLIAGNRGVGKTSLVSWVINETSLKNKTGFTENFKFAFLVFFSVIGIQIISGFCQNVLNINKIIIPWVFIFILSFVLQCCFNSYRHKIPEQKQGILNKIWNYIKSVFDCFKSAVKELSYLTNPYNPYGKTQYLLKVLLIVSFTQLVFLSSGINPKITFFIYLVFIVLIYIYRMIKKSFYKNKKEKMSKNINYYLLQIKNLFVVPIWNYIKNNNRLYLRINFGHKLKDEKDILRLITRTLTTEYNKYHRSFRRMLPWRIMALIFILIFTCWFSPVVEGQNFYIKLTEYKNMNNVTPKIITDMKIFMDKDDKIENKSANLKPELIDIIGSKIGIILYALDQIVYDISIKIIKDNLYGYNIYFPFWISLFFLYLCYKIMIYIAWKLHLVVTHKIITKQLKKLNNNITYSTGLEKSIGINSEKASPLLGIKTKRNRNIADAREIEKELQDILNDMQRIPVIMCRPNIVIVFDELDKVEPGDDGVIKENPQSKASLFSIDAARERQTEILKILSNMKYFLSTARAKFIFIAGREMYDIHLADVSERNNYIGSIFNAAFLVPSFLTDHHTDKIFLPQESSITSLPEEFVCRRLIPHDYAVDEYNLRNYRIYLEKVIYIRIKNKQKKDEMIQKIIAVLQQFIVYLAHLSKGAPKKMIQLFESFIDIRSERDNNKNILLVQRYHSSRHFLSFNYYKQYTIGIIAYLITPVFYRLAENNIKEHSDKFLISSLRFIDFLFKFHKNAFSWKHLDMSPEMLEINHAPELKSIAVDLLNYLTQVHINKSNFSLSEYKFDGLIANEIFAMAKTDEVFSALFSFSLDEMLPLRLHYQNLLEKTKKEYDYDKNSKGNYIDAISSLQVVLGDMHYYDDQLEEAEAYYKSSVHELRENDKKSMTLEQLYVYVRNMLRLGIIYEKRKQYDFAYMTYGEICERVIFVLDNACNNDMLFKKMAFEGLKMLYLPFIAKFQILEQGHMSGITSNYLKQLDDTINSFPIHFDHEESKFLKAEFFSCIADVIYYKNFKLINDKLKLSCTACRYYFKALSAMLKRPSENNPDKKTILELLNQSIKEINENYNMKFCTILARILSDWGNVFFSCDNVSKDNLENSGKEICFVWDGDNCNTASNISSNDFLEKCIKYLESEKENDLSSILKIDKLINKKDIAFAMYSISSEACRRASLYKRSSYQLYKMLFLFKRYDINEQNYINKISQRAIHYLLYANDDLNVLELNKRKKDFGREPVKKLIPLQNLLIDSEITRIRILVRDLKLKSTHMAKDLKKYYKMRITSPYKINYSVVGRIYQIRLKSRLNYETYQKILEKANIPARENKNFILEKKFYDKIIENERCTELIKEIFGEKYGVIQIMENLIAETIYCLMDAAQLLETMEETYLFPHSFIGSVHEHLSFWVRQYEEYETYKDKNSHIDSYLKQYLDEEWREQLSGYRENQKALSHYFKCLEMHSGGRAYHNMIDIMVYLKDEYNDRSDHFNIAGERHLINNKIIEKKINKIRNIYKNSKLYNEENYYNI